MSEQALVLVGHEPAAAAAGQLHLVVRPIRRAFFAPPDVIRITAIRGGFVAAGNVPVPCPWQPETTLWTKESWWSDQPGRAAQQVFFSDQQRTPAFRAAQQAGKIVARPAVSQPHSLARWRVRVWQIDAMSIFSLPEDTGVQWGGPAGDSLRDIWNACFAHRPGRRTTPWAVGRWAWVLHVEVTAQKDA